MNELLALIVNLQDFT